MLDFIRREYDYMFSNEIKHVKDFLNIKEGHFVVPEKDVTIPIYDDGIVKLTLQCKELSRDEIESSLLIKHGITPETRYWRRHKVLKKLRKQYFRKKTNRCVIAYNSVYMGHYDYTLGKFVHNDDFTRILNLKQRAEKINNYISFFDPIQIFMDDKGIPE